VKALALIAVLALPPSSGCGLLTAAAGAVLDCTVKDLSGLEAVADTLVSRLTNAPDATWSAVTTDLEKAGSTIGTCIASDLLDIATGAASIGSANMLYRDAIDVEKCQTMLSTVKAHFKITTKVKTSHGLR